MRIKGYAQIWFNKGYYFIGDAVSVEEARKGNVENVEFLQCNESHVSLDGAKISDVVEIIMVTITEEEYERLLDDSRKLNALECGGVDNWSFYGEAMQMYYNGNEEDEEDNEE